MRYGSDDRDFWTKKMLQAIDGIVDEERLQQIICAAESVLIDHYAKQGPSLNFYDVDNDEHVIMMLDQVDAANNYIVRVTQIVHASLFCLDIPGDQLFIYAAFDYPSLLENLKFERDQSAGKEDYEEAVSFRELISSIDKKTKGMSQDEPSE